MRMPCLDLLIRACLMATVDLNAQSAIAHGRDIASPFAGDGESESYIDMRYSRKFDK